MTESFSPEMQELLAGYVLGNLSSTEAEQFSQLLSEHPTLAAEVAQLQKILEVMPYGLPEVAPPENLRGHLLAIADRETPTNLPISAHSHPKPQVIFSRSRLVAAAAAVLALAIGIDNYRIRQQVVNLEAQVARQKDAIAMLQQPNTYLVSMKGMAEASKASGSIIITPGEPKAVLILQNLPILPPGRYYQLWSVNHGQKIPWEQFKTNERGTVFIKLDIPSYSEVPALMVTVETSPSPTSPAGPMVMTSTL